MWTFVGLKPSSSEEYLELDAIDNMFVSGCHIVLYGGLESCACRIVTSTKWNFLGSRHYINQLICGQFN